MFANNKARLRVVENMKNKFDYTEFVELCSQYGVDSLDKLEFAQKIGILHVAQQAHPDKPVDEAYITFIQTEDMMPIKNTHPQEPPVKSTSCCGGGRVV